MAYFLSIFDRNTFLHLLLIQNHKRISCAEELEYSKTRFYVFVFTWSSQIQPNSCVQKIFKFKITFLCANIIIQ